MYEIWFCNIICIYSLCVRWCKTFSVSITAVHWNFRQSVRKRTLLALRSSLIDTWRWATCDQFNPRWSPKIFLLHLNNKWSNVLSYFYVRLIVWLFSSIILLLRVRMNVLLLLELCYRKFSRLQYIVFKMVYDGWRLFVVTFSGNRWDILNARGSKPPNYKSRLNANTPLYLLSVELRWECTINVSSSFIKWTSGKVFTKRFCCLTSNAWLFFGYPILK